MLDPKDLAHRVPLVSLVIRDWQVHKVLLVIEVPLVFREQTEILVLQAIEVNLAQPETRVKLVLQDSPGTMANRDYKVCKEGQDHLVQLDLLEV